MPHDIVRKDAPPAATIARLEAVLESVGFAARRPIVYRWSAAPSCHSCQVRFPNYPLIYANGKGVSPELAYAGALAEFVERLQCDVDDTFSRAGLIHHLPPVVPRTDRPLSDAAATAPALARTDIAAVVHDAPVTAPFVECVDVFGRTITSLPYSVLCMMTRTSGMCAGNTLEEALTHGICEVFERHVLRQLEAGRVTGLPTIPCHDLRLTSPVVRRQLEEIQSAGIDVVVKDGSLGGRFPVVGTILTDRAAGVCHVSFGSDPFFDAALSRCLTEAFQGTARLFRPMASDGAHRPLDTYNNPQVLREHLVEDAGPCRAERAFGEPANNREAMDFAMACVQRTGLKLYVRDFSLFGFPAYYVYVERLSALCDLAPKHLAHLPRHLDDVRATLFRIAWASPGDIAACATVLFDELVHSSPTLEAQFATSVLRAPVAACVGLRPLLALMLLEAGWGDKARIVLEWPPISEALEAEPPGRRTVERLLPAYVQARRGAVSAARLACELARAFDDPQAAPATPGNQHDQPAAAPLLLPRCATVYDCPSCPCRRYCRLDEWYHLARRMRERAAEIDQASLLHVLAR